MVNYLTPERKRYYERRIKELEKRREIIKNGGETKKGKPLNISAISSGGTEDLEKEIARLKKTYKDHTPPEKSDNQKNGLYKKAKKLLSNIMQGMPSKSEMWFMKKEGGKSKKMDKYESNSIARRHIKWEEKNRESLREFRNIMRILDPDNPQVGSTPFIRRCKSVDDYFNKIRRI